MDKIKEFLKKLQDSGVPVFVFRDPVTKLPSVSLSLLIISAALVVFGLIGKFAKLAGGFDIENSLSFFYGCAGMYLGRKITSNKTSVDEEKK